MAAEDTMSVDPFDDRPYSGAKLALYLGGHLVVTLRDVTPRIPHPGMWDLPGGGREPGETPVACILRETQEEIGLRLEPTALRWGRGFGTGARRGWFFVASGPSAWIGAIRFGDEGVGWRLMDADEYLRHPKAIPNLQRRLAVSRAAMRVL